MDEFGGELFISGSIGAPFWGLYQFFGFYEMMTSLIQRPALAERLLERLTLHHLELLRAYAAVGFDGVWVEDCYSSADLISLAHFRRFAAPYVHQLIAEINRLGMKSIYYFCGDVSDRLEDLVRMGPHALSLEESKKGFVIDIAAVDKVVADRTCLLGNFDAITLLEKGSYAEIAAEVERQLTVGRRRGRFVTSLGSPVTPRTPTAKVREWVEMARERSGVGDTLKPPGPSLANY
jgi:uroporphyrinogen-III decarboxylase